MSLVHFAVALTAASIVLYGAMMALFAREIGRRGVRRRPAPIGRAPRVTVFKPLAGDDDDLEENLESFARIEYPCFEMLLGVASSHDPAYEVAMRFVARHTELVARVVLTEADAATNPKVAQLVCLERMATGDLYVISDSNVRVRPSYLWSLVVELSNPCIGMVTSLFVGAGERTIGAALENLQLCASTAPGLLAMNAVTGHPFTVGKSMAIRRRDLAKLGGFSPVGQVLAEDHALGRRFLAAGFLARTSLDAVENRNVACTVMRTIERHTRWSKMRRALFPWPFVLEPLMTPIAVASLAVAVAPCTLTAVVLAVVCVLQTAGALLTVRVLRGSWLAWWYAPLEVVRSYVALLCWVRACASRRIVWRGHAFVLKRGTTIVPVASPSGRAATRARATA
ncbi:MAG: glycosyltransferase [Myxococcota bacterium]|nr:glycosyltransferase [Myxococcota bacterium]